MSESRFSQVLDEHDIVFNYGTDDPIGVMLLRQTDNAQWEGKHQPALESEGFRALPMNYLWKNGGQGAGFSIRTPEVTAATQGGSLTSLGYSYGEWITSVVPGLLMPSGAFGSFETPASVTAGTIVDGISYGGHYYLTTSGRYLIKIADETGATSAIDLGVGYTCVNLAVFAGYLWISGQNSGTIRRYDGTTLTNGGAGTERGRLATVNWTISPQIATGGAANGGGTNADRMIGTNPSGTSFQHVADNVDPTADANWSSDIKIGDGASYTTQWVCANNHTVWFATNGGVIACDETGYTPNLTEWMKLHYNASNGGQAFYWNGGIWYAHESGLVFVPVSGERQDLAETFAQFGYLVPNQSPIYGRPRAIAPTTQGLFVGYVNTQTGVSYVMRLIINSDGSIRWSGPEAVLSGETITLIRQVSPASGTPFLLICTQVAGGASPPKIYTQKIPVSGNPYVDWLNVTGHQFAAASTLYLPREDFESASRKTVERYALVARNLSHAASATRSISVYASVDDGDYVLQGTSKKSPRQTMLSASTTTNGVNWQWKLTMVGTSLQPWILESFGAQATILPDDQLVRTYPVMIAPSQGTLGGEEWADPYRRWKQLAGLRRQPRVVRRDVWRDVATVKIEQTVPHQPIWDSKRQAWVLVASITERVLIEPTRYRAGFRYSAGAVYGESP